MEVDLSASSYSACRYLAVHWWLCRHQWYETGTHVIVSVFAKKMTEERVNVSLEEDGFTVQTKSEESEQEYELVIQLKGKVGLLCLDFTCILNRNRIVSTTK